MKDDFIMLPTVDFCFKELMQNPKVRKGFIAALLKISPDEICKTTLLPTILQGSLPGEKLGILDVRVQLEDGTQMDMEMQVDYFAHWDKRVLFYLGRMYTEQLGKGEPYENLKKCIHVSILDFICFPEDEECYRVIHLRDDRTGKLYTDILEIQILELGKLSRKAHGKTDIISWMKFFGGKNREEFEQMAKTNEYLDEAYKELVNLSADEQKRLEYEAREKALKDYNSQMKSASDYGLRRGFEKGLTEGIEKGLTEGIEKGLTEGLMKGRARGLTEGRVQSVLEILEDMGEIPEKLRQNILREQDVEKLKSWLKIASKSDSIDEFREKALL